MERKIVLEVEELEERIAPHAYLGESEMVRVWSHGGTTHLQNPSPNFDSVPEALQVPNQAWNGLAVASGD